MIPKSLLFMLILAHVSQVVLSQARPPSNVPRLRGLRPPNPAVQSGFFGGLGSLLMDNDQLQEKPCGRRSYGLATPPPSLRLWGFQSDPIFVCNCKIFSDGFYYSTIDNSPQARNDCMTEYSGLYCCMRT